MTPEQEQRICDRFEEAFMKQVRRPEGWRMTEVVADLKQIIGEELKSINEAIQS